jgi:hypothetical protein
MDARLSLLGLVLAAVLLAGCGSSAKTTSSSSSGAATQTSPQTTSSANVSSTSPSAALSHAQLISRADAVCAKNNITSKAATTKISTPAQLREVASERASVEQSALVDLAKLTPPPTLTSQWEAFLTARRKIVHALTEISEGGTVEKRGAAFTAFTQAESKIFAEAKATGLQVCSRLG